MAKVVIKYEIHLISPMKNTFYSSTFPPQGAMMHRAAGMMMGLEILDQPYGEEQIVNLVDALVLSEQPFVYQCGDGGFHGIG